MDHILELGNTTQQRNHQKFPTDTISSLAWAPTTGDNNATWPQVNHLAVASWNGTVDVFRIESTSSSQQQQQQQQQQNNNTNNTGASLLFTTASSLHKNSKSNSAILTADPFKSKRILTAVTPNRTPILSTLLTDTGHCVFAGCGGEMFFTTCAVDHVNNNGAEQQGTFLGRHNNNAPISSLGIFPTSSASSSAAAGIIVSAGWDAVANFWDPRAPTASNCILSIPPTQFNGPITDLSVSSAAGPFAVFLTARRALVFDVRYPGQNLLSIQAPNEIAPLQNRCLSLLREAPCDRIAVGTIDGTVWWTDQGFNEIAAINNNRNSNNGGNSNPSSSFIKHLRVHAEKIINNDNTTFMCSPVNKVSFVSRTAIVSCSSAGTIEFTNPSSGDVFFPRQALGRLPFPTQVEANSSKGSVASLPISAMAVHDRGHLVAYARSEDFTLGLAAAKNRNNINNKLRVGFKELQQPLLLLGSSPAPADEKQLPHRLSTGHLRSLNANVAPHPSPTSPPKRSTTPPPTAQQQQFAGYSNSGIGSSNYNYTTLSWL